MYVCMYPHNVLSFEAVDTHIQCPQPPPQHTTNHTRVSSHPPTITRNIPTKSHIHHTRTVFLSLSPSFTLFLTIITAQPPSRPFSFSHTHLPTYTHTHTQHSSRIPKTVATSLPRRRPPRQTDTPTPHTRPHPHTTRRLPAAVASSSPKIPRKISREKRTRITRPPSTRPRRTTRYVAPQQMRSFAPTTRQKSTLQSQVSRQLCTCIQPLAARTRSPTAPRDSTTGQTTTRE